MSSVDERALDVARNQRGLLTRRQLEAAGVSVSTIARRTRSGRWTEPAPGVIDLTTHPSSWHKGLHQAVLAAGGDAWVSHASAAYLHEFLDRRRPDRYDVLVRRGGHTSVAGLPLHTTTRLDLDEVTTVAGLPVTTRARTLLDLAPTVTLVELERLTADLGRRDEAAIRQVGKLLMRHRHAAGRRRLLDVFARLPDDLGRLGSPLEAIFVPELLRHGAPLPVLQYAILDLDGAFIMRPDLAWPELRRYAEIDGRAYHDAPADRERDAAKRERARAAGWHGDVLRYDDLFGDAPARVAAELRAAAAHQRAGS